MAASKHTRVYELKYYKISMHPVKVIADSLSEAQMKFLKINSPGISHLTPGLLDTIIEV